MARRRTIRLTLPLGLSLAAVLAVAWMRREELIEWYRLYREFERLGDNSQGYREYRHRKTGIVFVRLPGGTLLTGGANDDSGLPDDAPPRQPVLLEPFLIAKFEVSRKEWARVTGSSASGGAGDDLPVTALSWHDAQEFCSLAELRLPTEAQWEYACRAGSGRAFSFGDDPARLGDHAWYWENAQNRPHPVGEKEPNAFGLHDMHGNALEWCDGPYDPQHDPLDGGAGVVRGGSWFSDARCCRSAHRLAVDRESDLRFLGLRPVWRYEDAADVPEEDAASGSGATSGGLSPAGQPGA